MMGAIAGVSASGLLAPARGWAAQSADVGGDAAIIARALAVEQLLVYVYRRVLSTGTLHPAVTHVVGELLTDELAHVRVLQSELARLGGAIPTGPTTTAAADRALARHHVTRRLDQLHRQHDCLKLLVDAESVVEGAYFTAVSKLQDPVLLRIALETMGCEAQHWTVLSGLQNRGNVLRSVPYPFVAGST